MFYLKMYIGKLLVAKYQLNYQAFDTVIERQTRLTQSQVCGTLDINYRTYQAYEQNVCCPRIDTIIKLAQLFNVSLHELCYVNLQDKEAVEAYHNTLKERQQLEAA